MTFLVLAVILPVFVGLLLGQFARGKKRRKTLSLVMAICVGALVVAYGQMEFDSLIKFFYEPGADELYSVFMAGTYALIIRPVAMAVVAFAVSWITARLRSRLVCKIIDRGDRRRGQKVV